MHHGWRQQLKDRGNRTISGGDGCRTAQIYVTCPLHWCLERWPPLPSPDSPGAGGWGAVLNLTGEDPGSLALNLMLRTPRWPCLISRTLSAPSASMGHRTADGMGSDWRRP